MAKCPLCEAVIEDDIGLVTCASCGAHVLLELDGSLTTDNENTSPSFSQSQSHSPPSPPEFEAELNLGADLESMPSEAASLLPQTLEPTPAAASRLASPDMSDVVEFGNSTLSQGREGSLRFHVSILGIDTGEVRKQIIDILADTRFLWDAQSLMSKMRNGRIDIRDLTAVKASLLVQRLRTVPVEVFWEQYVIHQA